MLTNVHLPSRAARAKELEEALVPPERGHEPPPAPPPAPPLVPAPARRAPKPRGRRPMGAPRQPGVYAADRLRLPIYDSIRQCATSAHIPITVQKRAKAEGCGAFSGHKVSLEPLLAWLFTRGDNGTDFDEIYKKFRALNEEVKHSRLSGESLDKDTVHGGLARGMAVLFGRLDRLANVELPPRLKHLPESEIQTALLKAIEELKSEFRAGLEKLMEAK